MPRLLSVLCCDSQPGVQLAHPRTSYDDVLDKCARGLWNCRSDEQGQTEERYRTADDCKTNAQLYLLNKGCHSTSMPNDLENGLTLRKR